MERKFVLNASIGTIILLVASGGLGISLLAGGVAGYLESRNPRAGARIGVTTGAVALGLMLIFSMVREIHEAFDIGIAHYLWVGLGHPATDGILPFLVLPLVGGAIGAYIRAETTST